MEIRDYSRVGDALTVPNLVDIQTRSYERFLQKDTAPQEREDRGLEGILRETFPIESYDGKLSLEYIHYTLGRPRYTPDECRKLRLTYGYPFKIRCRLHKTGETIEEDVYVGELPIMIGGGEFVINGAERVIVSQLHRSPGVDFNQDVHSSGKRLHACRIIPERGSWIEFAVSKKDVLTVRIDQSGKFPATTLLRAMSEDYSNDGDILRAFYETETVKVSSRTAQEKLAGRVVVGHLINSETGEVIVESGQAIPENMIETLVESNLKQVEVIQDVDDPMILNTLAEDQTDSHEAAILRIYRRLHPGNPPQIEKATEFFNEKFFDSNRYRLGRVGRFRLNRKFEQEVSEEEMTLRPDDILNALHYIVKLRATEGEIDDIDHLGNRRVRTIEELAGDELRKGFLKLKRTVQERMSIKDEETLTARTLINSRTVSSSIEYFFGRGELSQVVDQVNPLSQLTHERRLSALGPGGLNRKRAGFDVRDVHTSHYGRICPIETPEGTNIGLIVSLGVFAGVDEYGFLVTPYRRVEKGKLALTKNEDGEQVPDVRYLRADEEDTVRIAPADTLIDEDGRLQGEAVLVRQEGDFFYVSPDEVDFVDISPKQMVGVSASLIPFLEHNDANRALMGSNMQRQAVPLLTTEPPLVGTGMEKPVASNSGMVIRAEEDGVVTHVSADAIIVRAEGNGEEPSEHEYRLRKFVGLSERTCLNQKPIVREGQGVKRGEVIADGASTHQGELALGRNVLVAFMPFDGYNFEDAILVSEDLVREDRYTSIHIEEFEVEIRETKLGREEFTRDIPNVSEKALSNLDEEGIVRVGTRVKPGDYLVGKVSPKSKSELSPEEKLLLAIFGRAGEDVKNDSLTVPSGVDGIVIDTQKFSRRAHLSEEQRQRDKDELKRTSAEYNERIAGLFGDMIAEMSKALDGPVISRSSGEVFSDLEGRTQKDILKLEEAFDPEDVRTANKKQHDAIQKIYRERAEEIEIGKDKRDRRVDQLRRGDELPTGVLEMVKVYVATKRVLSVGDKMAGRHGNKGVIAKILPVEDMPFLEDGTPVGMVLNPLGVPSRMNVGQILETHLGWAAKAMGYRVMTPVFDGMTEEQIRECLVEAGLPEDGKAVLCDGRTGKSFDQKVTVGYMYMLKLDHLVDDKVHARATGPYSLITQQPLGGKARFGGQRFGEMEVWALEAYGAAHVLQELLTVKSDDVEGRTKIYESMVKGENSLEAGTPVSFDVLMNEIKGLCLNIRLEKRKT
jgi:DNA-directed RNA polymerase subunit beta